MKIWLDKHDDQCTPTVKYCCWTMFQYRNKIDIMTTGKPRMIIDLEGDNDPEIIRCPFCGEPIIIDSGDPGLE